MIARGLAFGGVAAAMILGGAWLVTSFVTDPTTGRAVWTSAMVALVAQVGAFAVVWPIVTRNPIAGWGVGSLIRFVTVLVYAFVGVRLLGLPSGPALFSLVGFLFVTMLVEPFFLKR